MNDLGNKKKQIKMLTVALFAIILNSMTNMDLQISRRSSNFSQFSDDLWLTVKAGDASVDVDILESELLEFSCHMLDMAYDALNKHQGDHSEIKDKIVSLMNELYEKKDGLSKPFKIK